MLCLVVKSSPVRRAAVNTPCTFQADSFSETRSIAAQRTHNQIHVVNLPCEIFGKGVKGCLNIEIYE